MAAGLCSSDTRRVQPACIWGRRDIPGLFAALCWLRGWSHLPVASGKHSYSPHTLFQRGIISPTTLRARLIFLIVIIVN